MQEPAAPRPAPEVKSVPGCEDAAPRWFAEGGLRLGVGGRADVHSQATETRSLRGDIRPAHPVTQPTTPAPSPPGTFSAKNLAVPRVGVCGPARTHRCSHTDQVAGSIILEAGDYFVGMVILDHDLEVIADSEITTTMLNRRRVDHRGREVIVVRRGGTVTGWAGRMSTRSDLVSVACEWTSARPPTPQRSPPSASQRGAASSHPQHQKEPSCRKNSPSRGRLYSRGS